MANTINDLYLKYVNKVGKTLENDRYFQYLFEIVQAGDTKLQQTHQILHKVVDERWLSVIEESLDALNRITEKPRRFVTTSEEVVPVALAKKITADSVRHLSMNTQFIASNENGDIHPTRILNVTTEETYDLYENRFIYHLIQRLVTFIDKRTDVIFWSTGDETRNTLKMHSNVDDAYEQIEYKLELTVKNRQSFAENDSDNMQVFMRIDRVRRLVMALRNSSFCDLMNGCARVTSPIQRTNLMMKDPDYRTCFKLWQFLESYEEVGYTIEAKDSVLEFDEEYLLQLYSNLITNYTVFKSLLEADPRKLAEIPPKRRKVIKPKFLKKIEEQIVDDYDIPDVEIRKVIVEEVTQAQLDAEAKLSEETARREAAETARDEVEKAFEDYRWQMQFQQEEAANQAAAERENHQAAMEAARQEAEKKLVQTKAEAEQREADLQAAMEAARQEAEEKLAQAKVEAEQREAELQAAMEAARQEAEAKLAQMKAEAEQKEAEAEQREAKMREAIEAARQKAAQTYFEAQTRQQEMADALKTAEADLQTAIEARDHAAEQERIALQQLQKETSLRLIAEAKAEKNTLTNRIFTALAQRRAEKESAEKEKNDQEEDTK